MKYLFFFFVFLSIQFALSQEIPSYTNLLNYESSINLQQISYEKHRGFYFDPVIELNGNRGNFKTSFSIEMPSNLANFRFLTLNYNSAQSANYGLGVGFGWHLPFITYESSATTRVKYTFHGKKASGSLVETKEVLSKLKDSLVLNLKTLRPNVDLVGMNSYRPLVDRSFDLFVKMTTTDGIYWVIVKLNGNRWFLNKEGLPVGMINQLNNHITFTWQDNVLIKLEDGHKNWHMDIKYLNKFNEKTSYHRQLFSLPKGIESIKTWNQQKLVRHLKFVYDDEYLLTAKYKSALMPLFQGKYNGYAAKIVGEQTNNYLVHDDKLPVFIDSSETATAQIIDPTSHIYKMFVDINNDGIEDKITFDYTAIFNQIESFYKGIDFADYVDEGNRTLQLKKSKMDKINPILEQLPVIDLKVSIKDSDTQIRFLEDTKLLKVLQQIRLLNFFLKKKILKKDGYTIKYWEIKTFANGVNFVDLNSDGKKDIVSCPGSQEFANKKFEIQSSPFIVNGKNVKRSVSPLYLQAITFAYPENSIDTNKFVNPFQVAGDIATVFIQKADFEFLDALKASTQGETFSSASILESYNWKPRADLKVRCHQHSLFVDYNKDGFVDVISGKDIYFNNGGHGFVKDDFSNKAQNIFEKGDQQLDVELNDFSFADLNGNGKLEIYQAKKIKTLRKKSTTQIIKAGVTQKHIRSSGRKLLAQLLSPFGGHIKIDYQNQEGRFIVKSLETVDEKAEVIKRFDYIGKAFDPITHVFTGYGQIAMKVSYPADETQRIIEHTIERGFYTEQNVRDYVLGTKGEISGLLQVEVTSQNQADATNFPDKKELRNHWTLLELSGKRVHPFVHIAQNNVLQYEIEDNDNKYMITKSKKTTKSFDNWQLAGPSQKIFPLTINTHIQGHGLYSSYHDQMLDGAKMINVGHDYLDNFYMRVLNYKKEVGRDGKLLSPILKARMRDDHGLARKICKGEKCVRIAYDHLGRKIKIKSDFDELHRQNVSYYEGLPLASTYTSKAGSYSYSYDSNLFNLNKIHRDGQILFEYDFYDDGILKQIKNNKAIIYHLTPFTSEVATPEVQEGQNADTYLIYKKDFNLLTSGADLTITVDGLGNIVNQAQTLNGSLRFKGQKTYLGQKLISKTYPSVDSKSDAIYLTYNYDGLGRLLKKRQADLLEYSFEFSNGSSKQTLNGDLVLGN
ncbi:MAG: VCBS repeat-containing protein, partial [Bacteriovoracaceae bacterium]|nr:VCBS repeat-containing protein [Bacteriovoracaceae bacterium]